MKPPSINRIFLLLLLFSGGLNAQTAKETLKSILEPYHQVDALYFELDINYFEGKNNEASDQLNGVYHRYKDKQYIKMGPTEMLMTEALSIVADHDDKLLVVHATNQSELPRDFDLEQLEKLSESDQTTIEYVNSNNGLRALKIKPEDSGEYYVLSSDPFTHQVKRLELFSNAISDDGKRLIHIRIEINYKVVELGKTRPFNWKTDQFVQVRNGKYIPSERCKGYTQY